MAESIYYVSKYGGKMCESAFKSWIAYQKDVGYTDREIDIMITEWFEMKRILMKETVEEERSRIINEFTDDVDSEESYQSHINGWYDRKIAELKKETSSLARLRKRECTMDRFFGRLDDVPKIKEPFQRVYFLNRVSDRGYNFTLYYSYNTCKVRVEAQRPSGWNEEVVDEVVWRFDELEKSGELVDAFLAKWEKLHGIDWNTPRR